MKNSSVTTIAICKSSTKLECLFQSKKTNNFLDIIFDLESFNHSFLKSIVSQIRQSYEILTKNYKTILSYKNHTRILRNLIKSYYKILG